MSNQTAKHEGEELVVEFQAKSYMEDYGVPRSRHRVIDPDTYEVLSLEILGEEVDFHTLPKKAQSAILELADPLDFEPDF